MKGNGRVTVLRCDWLAAQGEYRRRMEASWRSRKKLRFW
jgi:hypothetical protein